MGRDEGGDKEERITLPSPKALNAPENSYAALAYKNLMILWDLKLTTWHPVVRGHPWAQLQFSFRASRPQPASASVDSYIDLVAGNKILCD